ncbi:neuroglian-like [Contarinia nasturtii]|uniref:neuroglian-like n=1 Tax=Contarinia nasturtii TaxID=265458 RepID=UPI0012D409E1|nr:neuroglian-like [Contarinia nasturtii]
MRRKSTFSFLLIAIGTCLIHTFETLSAQDVTFQPYITHLKCFESHVHISWKKQYNAPPIRYYIVEYNTSFSPNSWESLNTSSDQCSFNTPLTPWKNYSFRIIPHNEIDPLKTRHNCSTNATRPFRNPNNVKDEGTTPTNLEISWDPIESIDHFGPEFDYRIYWKRNIPDAEWNVMNITDESQSRIKLPHQPTCVSYRIKVEANNKLGKSKVESAEIIGSEAPKNVIVTYLLKEKSAILRWSPVSPATWNGHFTFYYVEMVTPDTENNVLRTFFVNSTEIKIQNLTVGVYNYAKIMACNNIACGPQSHLIEIFMLPDVPGRIENLEAFPLGSSAFLLRWKPMIDSVMGYNIYYKDELGKEMARSPQIKDPYVDQAKLNVFEVGSKTYELSVAASFGDGREGKRATISAKTKAKGPIAKLDKPSFKYDPLPIQNDWFSIKVIWMPNVMGEPGVDFRAEYRITGDHQWTYTEKIKSDDFVIIDQLSPYEIYEVVVVSIEGTCTARSDIQEITRGLVRPTTSHFVRNVIIGLTIVVLCFILVSFVAFKFYRRKSKKRNSFESLNDQNSHKVSNKYQNQNRNVYSNGEQRNNSIYYLYKFEEGNIDCLNPELMLDEQADLLPYDRKYEFPREKLILGIQLGAGAFGVVVKGVAHGIVPYEDETTVAVKMVKSLAGYEILRALALELKILVHLGRHLNVVNLLGAVTKDISKRELMLIVEYCAHGNLQSYLIRNRAHFCDQINHEEDCVDSTITPSNEMPSMMTTTDLLIWSFQIARGMHYLASRKVLHGDLAARNVLLCNDNVVKICDFGLARSMYKTSNYQIKTQRALPFKWLSLESISDLMFTSFSDVWSYGVVLWELFSLGATPYPGMNAGTPLYTKLKGGYRMEKPQYATQNVYDIMLSCWQEAPQSRPLFDKLEEMFKIMLDRSVSEHYIILNEPYLMANRLQSVTVIMLHY